MSEPNALLTRIVEKATPYGHQDGDFIAYYIIPTGPIHRAILHLQQNGYAIPNPSRSVSLVSPEAIEAAADAIKQAALDHTGWTYQAQAAISAFLKVQYGIEEPE